MVTKDKQRKLAGKARNCQHNPGKPLESRNSKQYKLRTLNRKVAVETYVVQTVGRILHEKQVENEGAVWKRRRRVQTEASYTVEDGRRRRDKKQSKE